MELFQGSVRELGNASLEGFAFCRAHDGQCPPHLFTTQIFHAELEETPIENYRVTTLVLGKPISRINSILVEDYRPWNP